MDKQLEGLFNFINGKTFPFGKGITTYPNSDDDGQKKLHSALLKLEKIGKVERHLELEKEAYVVWKPVGDTEIEYPYEENYATMYFSSEKFEWTNKIYHSHTE